MMRKAYFDDKNYLLRTHVILQEIKKYGGNKGYLEARKLLLVAWLACKEGEAGNTAMFPSLSSYNYLLLNLEKWKTENQKIYYFSNVTSIDNVLGFYPNYREHGYFFSVPYELIMKKTPHQTHVAVEKYILEQKQIQNGFWDDEEWGEVEEDDDFDLWHLH